MISGYGFMWKQRRYGGMFQEQLKEFKKREEYSLSQWRDYQTEELRKLLTHAYTTVPYYQRTFRQAGIDQNFIQRIELEDLSKLPVLEKETLRKVGTTELLSSKREKGGEFFTSSGSTGTPVKILFSEPMHQKWRAAFEARIYNWAGITRNDGRGMIGGRLVVPGGDKAKPPFYRYNYFEKQIYFSIYHIRKQNAWNYLEAIRRYKPAFMTGYAASNFLLASYFEELGYEVEPLKAVITSSEKLTLSMRNTMKRVYQCNVFDSWSGIEACGLISQYSTGQYYSSPDVAIVEVLDENMKPVRPGETGALYCTGFLNYDQPLIRYKIGDLVQVPQTTKTSGGLPMPEIGEIVGRIDDIVTLADGRQLSSFNRFFADIPGIKEIQVEQLDYDRFVLNMVVSENYTTEIEESILHSIHLRLGEVRVTMNKLDHIPRNANGKFKAVVSHIKPMG
jgi:phenylacetate-CoA ligase